MQQIGRTYSAISRYRYGFNGQEKDAELNEAILTALYWEYDSRVALRWNRDPKPFPEESEYTINKGNPIYNQDPKGDTPTGGPGDGTTAAASITLNIGTHNNSVSFKFSVTTQQGNVTASVGGAATFFSSFNNTGKSGVELRGSALAGWNDGKNSITAGTNLWRGLGGMSEFKQRTGILNLKFGDFTASYENDGMPFALNQRNTYLADGNDSYRTAAVRIGIGQFSAGFNLFTGLRTSYKGDGDKVGNMKYGSFGERMPNGFVLEDKGSPRYRMGAAYVAYGETKLGIDSDRWIRHPIQDHFAHNWLSKQPGFPSLSKTIRPYIQVQYSQLFSTNTLTKFTLH
jgi:Bacterial toxin 23